MCRADYVNQCNAADWRKRRRPAPRRDPVETADGKFLLLFVYAPRALTARACFLSYVHPVHYNVVTDEARGADDPLSPVL